MAALGELVEVDEIVVGALGPTPRSLVASDDEMRRDCVEEIRPRLAERNGVLRVLMDSLAMSWMKPLAGAEDVIARKQLEITVDTMGHSLVPLRRCAIRPRTG